MSNCTFLAVFMCLCVFSGTLKLPESVKWLKLNYRNTGFYIVHYGDEGWDALTAALHSNVSVLTHEDRASLIHNIFALSRYERQYNNLISIAFSNCFQETQVEEYFPVLVPHFPSPPLPHFLSRVVNRLGRVSFHQVLSLLNYMSNETETSPVTEALLQLSNIYRLLDKRQEHGLVSRMKVLHTHTRLFHYLRGDNSVT